MPDDGLRRLLRDQAFRDFLAEIVHATGVFRSSVGVDVYDTYMREGARAVGLKVLDRVRYADPEAFAAFMKGHMGEELEDE